MIGIAKNVAQAQIDQAEIAVAHVEQMRMLFKNLNDQHLAKVRMAQKSTEWLVSQYEQSWTSEDELEVEEAARILLGLVPAIGTQDGEPSKVLPQLEYLRLRIRSYLLYKRAMFKEAVISLV